MEELKEMNEMISRVEIMARRGLLSVYEAELRITRLIDDTLPEPAFTSREEWERIMEQRRLLKRREWRFLLSLTKEKARFE